MSVSAIGTSRVRPQRRFVVFARATKGVARFPVARTATHGTGRLRQERWRHGSHTGGQVVRHRHLLGGHRVHTSFIAASGSAEDAAFIGQVLQDPLNPQNPPPVEGMQGIPTVAYTHDIALLVEDREVEVDTTVRGTGFW
jgi:hypothetical protein